ncbi:hypothetical protein HPB47_008428 [Ixodes persulcatus]|uniref:Uncharacterized protein n=1 Tax=Ixodes persulcatus TaxID=34615 RepID=A0AC60P4Q5_IXOPE|nr:hypothetical protein HPB47_008428 [Ixodes persulcatus]
MGPSQIRRSVAADESESALEPSPRTTHPVLVGGPLAARVDPQCDSVPDRRFISTGRRYVHVRSAAPSLVPRPPNPIPLQLLCPSSLVAAAAACVAAALSRLFPGLQEPRRSTSSAAGTGE